MIPTIAPELSALPHVPIDSLEPFQGNLKELSTREYNKLKKSLQEHGVIVPFFVWQETGKLLDGHQRSHVFEREAWTVDVPVVYISADSEQDAKRKLLVISSQYGKITQEGFDAFTFDLDDEWIAESIQFDALPFVFEDFGEQPSGWNDAFDSLPEGERAPFQQMTFTLHDSQVEQINDALKVAKGMGAFDTENENGNGNALARVCEVFVTNHGQS
jgi:hypothetical protein